MPAVATGIAVLIVLTLLHIHRGTEGTAAYRAGEVAPIGVISAAVVGLVAQGTRAKAPWVVWVSPFAIVAVSFAWYGVAHVLPSAVNDVRAQQNGQADYSLFTPATAGDWTRQDDEAMREKLEQAAAMMQEQASPDEFDEMNPVYAAYAARDGSQLIFLGSNATGGMRQDLRSSTRAALDDVMAGAGASDVQYLDAGPLGGSLACSDDLAALPDTAEYVVCSWADASTLGNVTIVQPGIDVERAADITRAFRDDVTRR